MAEFTFSALPPKEAIAFFRKKGVAISFNWKDVWKQEHAAAFTVAKAMNVDILEDIRGAVDQAIAKGVTYSTFQKNLAPVLQAKGWWGRKDMLDPKTGKIVAAQLGSSRRLRIIYDTNLRMSHAAGRWQQIERVKVRRPWLRYVAVQDERTRQQHKTWHGTVLPVDDKFWDSHYPPNGWRCRCIVQQLSEHDLKRFGHKPSKRPAIRRRTIEDERLGETLHVPEGIDKGFDYNVGKARLRALTPPPQGGLPQSFPVRAALPDLPTPRTLPASKILPKGLKDEILAKHFLDEFDVKPGRSKVFVDKMGENLTISDQLLKDRAGRWKADKNRRGPYLRILANTIKEPDEIWMLWEPLPHGGYQLRRRYIARFDVEGEPVPGYSVFETGSNGWSGVTIFPPKIGRPELSQQTYLNNYRSGMLAWRRKK